MKAADLQRAFETLHDTFAGAFDHLAEQVETTAESLGDEGRDLMEFAAGWTKLSKTGRRLLIEQLMKSTGLVLAGAVATKAGVRIASKKQKLVRNVLLSIVELIGPLARETRKKAVKTTRKAKKKTKK